MNEDHKSPNAGPAVSRADGITDSERYLKKLCDRTFLSLWSYPNVYRDQGGSAKGDGKEVCDLLVVFENHIIVFSDKHCAFPDSGDLTKDWSRWFKRAVGKSAGQVWGAERWIRDYADRLFVDPACEHGFPIDLPSPDEAAFHRVVVAHDSADRCRREFGGGSGSLILDTTVVGAAHHKADEYDVRPFRIGDIDPDKGYVHVLDDTTLDIVLATLDTITDFVEYLTRKEAFVRGGRAVMATGEEELLALYLSDVDIDDRHDFIVPSDVNAVFLEEGHWEEFANSPQRHAQLEANEVSYAWDALIEAFNKHIIGGTQYYRSRDGVSDSERTIRLLAREPRTRRRMLAEALVEVVGEELPEWGRRSRHILPSRPGDPYYVFLLLWPPPTETYERYREVRRKLLEAYCRVLKTMYPDAEDIVGIATEDGTARSRSEDAVYLDAREWNEEDQSEALDLQKEFDILSEIRRFDVQVREYPEVQALPRSATTLAKRIMKGRDRNLPCPCGSGRKFKKCCGGHTRES